MNNEERVEPVESKVHFQIGAYPEQVTYIGADMNEEHRSALCRVIMENKDLFAWTPSDMPGVDPKVMCHKLSICAEAKPIAQRKRKMGTERKLAVEMEVAKLLDAGFIREVHYTTWLANVVMVKKSNGKWRMCTDYTSLNKACPKDAYPLPNIDRLVDGASGHGILTFLDAYSGYNQIPMHTRDEEKTAFITDSANYCYQVMPFGLKNAGATYQRLMNKVFQHQIGRNMEVYVDDMVVKSINVDRHVLDLSEAFQQLRKYDMRLNPEKCVFGVSGGKFLGFMLSARGIEANPDKCMAIINMISPQSLKQVQQLTGQLTALLRFLPCLAEITKPIVALLRKSKKFEWSDECEEAFRTLKERLGSPPILSKPDLQLPIVVYLCVSNDAISTVLVQEKEKDGQQPIYFISRMLQEAETRYQLLEKVALGLVHTARRLRQYFQSHHVVVRTNCPISKVLRKPELAGRMMAWSIELSEFDIVFEPRGSIKSQYLADFVNELQPKGCFENDLWTMHVDGSSNNQGSGAGIILEGPTGLVLEQSLRFAFKASNNQAEYEALLAGLRLAREIGVSRLECWTDSKIVAEQVNNNFQVKDANLLKYYHLFQRMRDTFEEVQVKHTPRERNGRADQLARLASSTRKPGQLRTTLHLDLEAPSMVITECLATERSSWTWITDMVDYLEHGRVPIDSLAARKLRTQAARYTMVGGELYRRGFSVPLLKCVEAEQADYILREIHEGICGFHSGGRTLAAKVLRAGYYWPTLRDDCLKFVKHCTSCQQHGNLIHASAEELHGISSPWPFAMWGMDILGPFPIAKGQCKFLLVAVDYFTKWVEAKPLASITAANVQKILWKSIITRFGIPYALVTDNGL
uniref:Retrovirus-related Pol polyprotein from transposon 17.6 n=1 Tax=Cajanus cajan TaxID=3821 RepID=A0A151SG60_CAJCA|nr:Retrovirus-related Pol polyprotein from transposon 17.6 [Cajanus cajan]